MILLSIIGVLLLFLSMIFIGGLMREYVERLIFTSRKSVSPPYITRRYGPLETRTHWRWSGGRMVKTRISKRKGLWKK